MKQMVIICAFILALVCTSCEGSNYSCVCIGVTNGEPNKDFTASNDDEADDICDDWEDEKEIDNPFAECEEVYLGE